MAAMPVENKTAASPPSSAASFRSADLSRSGCRSGRIPRGLLLLDEVDHRLRVGEGVGRGAEDRIGDRVARLLPLFAGMDGQR